MFNGLKSQRKKIALGLFCHGTPAVGVDCQYDIGELFCKRVLGHSRKRLAMIR